jgi:tRNA pseudouridine(54/55) synthase
MHCCDLCKLRKAPDFTNFDDSFLSSWVSKFPSSSEESQICTFCWGLLQNGGGIVEAVQLALREADYADVFGCLLSVQFPAILLFRQYIEGITSIGDSGKDVRSVVRGLIQRSTISEQYSDKMPKLFVDVAFQYPESLVEVPKELVNAVNEMQRHKAGKQWYKSMQAVNISDVQHFIERTKGDISLVYASLFGKSELPDITEMRSVLESRFLNGTVVTPTVSVSLKRETVYLVGNYVKDTRDFGQSQWDAHETSVSETICPEICQLFKSPIDKCLFSASGREDMDVRMLGCGRSFVIQLGDAKSLEPLINEESVLKGFKLDTGDVKVTAGLRWVDKGVMDWLHWSTEQHLKVYRCIVWTEDVLPSQECLDDIHVKKTGLKILQKTPLRVLHRRTEQTREKTMYSLKGERLNDHFAIFTLHASAGAYIKEFVHGDFGRTSPCFSDVVFGKHVRCDILQLDVLEVIQEEEEQYVPIWDR